MTNFSASAPPEGQRIRRNFTIYCGETNTSSQANEYCCLNLQIAHRRPDISLNPSAIIPTTEGLQTTINLQDVSDIAPMALEADSVR